MKESCKEMKKIILERYMLKYMNKEVASAHAVVGMRSTQYH